MKKILLTLFAVLTVSVLFAQSPQAFKYQAVARDGSGEVLANQNVSLKISIIKGSPTGTSVYIETHSCTTNQFGLINLEIGNGTASDDFSIIEWGNDTYFLKVEMDASGGISYQEMGITQLFAVPYALHAKTAENLTSEVDGSTTNEIGGRVLKKDKKDEEKKKYQVLSISNDTIYLTNGGFVKLPEDQTDDADADPANELQDLTLNGTTLEITNGTSADLSSLQDGTGTDDQTLDLTNNILSIEDGNTVNLSEYLDNTDAQAISLSGNTLSITGNESTIDLSKYTSLWSNVTGGINYSDGNVGIGTTSPGEKLDADGAMNVEILINNKEGQKNPAFQRDFLFLLILDCFTDFEI